MVVLALSEAVQGVIFGGAFTLAASALTAWNSRRTQASAEAAESTRSRERQASERLAAQREAAIDLTRAARAIPLTAAHQGKPDLLARLHDFIAAEARARIVLPSSLRDELLALGLIATATAAGSQGPPGQVEAAESVGEAIERFEEAVRRELGE